MTIKEPETFEAAMSLLTLAAKAVENHPPKTWEDMERVRSALNRLEKVAS